MGINSTFARINVTRTPRYTGEFGNSLYMSLLIFFTMRGKLDLMIKTNYKVRAP